MWVLCCLSYSSHILSIFAILSVVFRKCPYILSLQDSIKYTCRMSIRHIWSVIRMSNAGSIIMQPGTLKSSPLGEDANPLQSLLLPDSRVFILKRLITLIFCSIFRLWARFARWSIEFCAIKTSCVQIFSYESSQRWFSFVLTRSLIPRVGTFINAECMSSFSSDWSLRKILGF
jgi:hypothetical protein